MCVNSLNNKTVCKKDDDNLAVSNLCINTHSASGLKESKCQYYGKKIQECYSKSKKNKNKIQ